MSKSPKKQNLLGTGYGTPPKATQFQKGQSGNPKGRPKGAKNKVPYDLEKLTDLIRSEAAREVLTGPQGERLAIQQALIRSILVNGIKGGPQSQRTAVHLLAQAEDAQDTPDFDHLEAYSQLRASLIESELGAKNMGWEYPKELPRPDQISYDSDRGEIVIHYPVGKREWQSWTYIWGCKHHLVREIALLIKRAKDQQLTAEAQAQIEDLLQGYERLLDLVNDGLADLWALAPEDMSGPETSLDALLEHTVPKDMEGLQLDGLVAQLQLLRNYRWGIELRAGKHTKENAPLRRFLNR